MIIKTLSELELEHPNVARFAREGHQHGLYGFELYDYVLTKLSFCNEKMKAAISAVVSEDPELVFGCTCTPTHKCAACQLRDLQ